MTLVQIIELLLTILAGGKIVVPIHIQDAGGTIDATASYDPKNGHVDFVNNK